MPILGRISTERSPTSTAPTVEPGLRVYKPSPYSASSMVNESSAPRNALRSSDESLYGALRSYSCRSNLRIDRATIFITRAVVIIRRAAVRLCDASELVQREIAEAVALPEQPLLDVRQHAMLPDSVHDVDV